MRRAAAGTRRCTSTTAQPPRPHLSVYIGPPLRRPMSWCTLCLSTSFRPISMSHLVIFAENASTSRRRFPYPPRAPNKASKATIADLCRYLVSHKAKEEREPCTPRDLCHVPKLQSSKQDRKPTGRFRTRQATTTDAFCFATRASPISPLHQSNHTTGKPLRSVCTFSPMVGQTDSQDKRISHAPPFDGVLRGRESHPPSQKLRRDQVSREVEIPDAWVHTEVWKTSLQ